MLTKAPTGALTPGAFTEQARCLPLLPSCYARWALPLAGPLALLPAAPGDASLPRHHRYLGVRGLPLVPYCRTWRGTRQRWHAPAG